MCERYVTAEQPQIERAFAVQRPWWRFARSFNVAPGRMVPVIRRHRGESEGVMLRWGLVPAWAEGDAAKRSLARVAADVLMHSADLREPWLNSQRCVLPAAGFYLWCKAPQGHRQPWFVRLRDAEVLGLAGIWERSVTEDDDVIESCAVITRSAQGLPAALGAGAHTLPVLVRPEALGEWLGAKPAAALGLLEPPAPASLAVHAVSPRINRVDADDSGLVEPVEPRTFGLGASFRAGRG